MITLLTVFVLQSPPGHTLQAIGLVPIAGVLPVLHASVNRFAAGGTPNPPRCRGGEFNELAPQPPEGLCAPCLRMARQRRGGRSPPSLKKHGATRFTVSRPFEICHFVRRIQEERGNHV